MKKIYIVFLAVLMALAACACDLPTNKPSGSNQQKQQQQQQSGQSSTNTEMAEGDGAVYPEEVEGATVTLVKTDPENFVGSWKGTSYNAVQLYGNVDITVNSDHTWFGNISDEELNGKWSERGDCIHLNSELFDFDLAFDDQGSLVMIERADDGDLYTVLFKR